MRTRHAFFIVLLHACVPSLPIPEEAHLGCRRDSDCPEGRLCDKAGVCEMAATLDRAPPLLRSARSDRAAGREGSVFRIALEVSELLARTPALALDLDVPALACAADGELHFTCEFTAPGPSAGGRDGAVGFSTELVDPSGNSSPVYLPDLFVLDYRPPVLAAKRVEPALVPAGRPLQVLFAGSEDLSAEPEARLRFGDAEPETLAVEREGTTRNYRALVPLDGRPDGRVAVEARMTDAVGNASEWLSVGEAVLDTAAPEVRALSAPERIGKGVVLAVSFELDQEVNDDSLRVAVGPFPLDCGAFDASQAFHRCTRAMTGDEAADVSETPLILLVRAADAAGNEGSASVGVLVDFRPPALVPVPARPARARIGDTVVLRLRPTEPLASTPASLVAQPGGAVSCRSQARPTPTCARSPGAIRRASRR